MRYLFLRLKHYKMTKSGLGLDEVFINFQLQKHKLCVIVGDNGSGKTTILKALHPYPDETNMLMENMISEKEEMIMHNDNVYRILITCNLTGNNRSTKASFQKNGIELNPNGNISSYKEIMEAELDLDPNTLLLSFLSFNQRGIADLTPGERKKYISNIISVLDVYNNMNKNFSKKVSILRSHINTIHNKINSIGNAAELSMTLDTLDLRVNTLKQKHDDLNKAISAAETTIITLDPDGSIQNTYQEIYNSLQKINSEIEAGFQVLDGINRSLKLDKNVESTKKARDKRAEAVNKILISIAKDEETLRMEEIRMSEECERLRIKSEKLNRMQSESNFEELEEIRVSTQKEFAKLCKIVNASEDVYRDMDAVEIDRLIEGLKGIVISIQALYDKYREPVLNSMIHRVDYTRDQLWKYRIMAQEDKQKIEQLKYKILDLQRISGIINQLSDRSPKCTDDNCEFIRQAVEFKTLYPNIDDEITKLETKLARLNGVNPEHSNKKEAEVENAVYDLRSILTMIESYRPSLEKIEIGHRFLDREEFLSRIATYDSFEDVYKFIDELLVTQSNRESKAKVELKLQALDQEINAMNANIIMIDDLSDEIQTIQDKVQEMQQSTAVLVDAISKSKKILEVHQKELDMLNTAVEKNEELDALIAEKQAIAARYDKIRDDIKAIGVYIEDINAAKSKLKDIDEELASIEHTRDNYRYSLTLLDEYQREMNAYQEKYNTLDTLKKYSSPNSGIQTLFISMYMNQTKDITNQLIQNFFDGEMQLDDYVINENEFRIPCRKGGWRIDDISSCSNAQICMMSMCISMALLQQASPSFNIPRWDEIDNGLDYQNSIMFVQMIYKLIYVFNIEQSFLISHSSESVLTDVDLIVLKYTSDNPLTGNVIYNYYEEVKKNDTKQISGGEG